MTQPAPLHPSPLRSPTRTTPWHCIRYSVPDLHAMLRQRGQTTTNKSFFKRLIAHGYKGNGIRPLFHKAITRAKAYSGPTQDEDDDHNSVILHLPFHPNDPASSRIQAEWRTHVAKPQWKLPLEHMKNPKTKEKCNIKRMIIAYKRPMNLGNLLSHRDLSTSPPVSSYLYA